MHRRSEELGAEVASAREEWERKRADPNVPGAPQPEEERSEDAGSETAGSPAPEAPPREAHPAQAEAPSETAVGPPADDRDD